MQRRIFPVKTQSWLPHALTRVSGPVRLASGKHATSKARVWAMRAILITAVVLGGVGALTAALVSQSSAGHNHTAIIAHPAVPHMY
jgi:hypothetical protein